MRNKLLLALVLFGASCLYADDNPTGYLRFDYWGYGVKGNATAKGASVDVSDSQRAFNGNNWGVIIGGEGRFDRWGLNMDLFFGRQLNVQRTSNSQTVNFDAEYAILTTGAFYPFVDKEVDGTDMHFLLDGFAGLRAYSNQYKVQYEPFNPGNNQDKSAYQNWVEPYLGLRLTSKLTHSLAVELYGDAGGFAIGDAAKLSVLTRANLVWTVIPDLNLIGGYRVFDLETANDESARKTELDMRMQGVTLGVECRFH